MNDRSIKFFEDALFLTIFLPFQSELVEGVELIGDSSMLVSKDCGAFGVTDAAEVEGALFVISTFDDCTELEDELSLTLDSTEAVLGPG